MKANIARRWREEARRSEASNCGGAAFLNPALGGTVHAHGPIAGLVMRCKTPSRFERVGSKAETAVARSKRR
jgi:hypothetical protein